MRTLHLWNRHDIAALSRGVSFDFKIGEEIHTHRAEHPYKAKAGGDGEAVARTLVRRKHSAQFKRRAVARLRKGEARATVARDLSISPSLLTAWAKKGTA